MDGPVRRHTPTLLRHSLRRSLECLPMAAEHDQAAARSAAPAISLQGVFKRYGSIVAVDGLDLEVPPGVCFGLLGPNGAGKSTTMRMLTAQALADEGRIRVLGYELPRESKQSRLEMGVVPQLDNLDVELTCRQILTVFARLYRVARGERAAAVQRALELANLTGRADTIVRELSGGMRRRLLVGVHTKFGVDSFARFADVGDFDALVTGRGLRTGDAARYSALGPEVVRV